MSVAASNRPDRAVIDIGSNTVRLVAFAGPPRVPRPWLNGSVNARLGRELATTGMMPEKAMKQALSALARYATILSDLVISDVLTVATAAVRDATNGPAFLSQVKALGLRPHLLTGEEEALGSAYGVIGAFPDARGTVADLGGGSLELVEVADGKCNHGVSLPLGTLRLPPLAGRGPEGLAEAARKSMRDAGWAAAHPGVLYLVGGTWRAFASYAIYAGTHPLSDPHAFSIDFEQAQRVADDVSRMAPAELERIAGISATRAADLPNAAALMRALLAELKPQKVVASSWGLREGLLFQRLSRAERAADPLLVAVSDFAEPRGGPTRLAHLIASWGSLEEAPPRLERLHLVSAQLALAASHIEPSIRARHAFEWAMDKRWVGLAPNDRAWIAAALLAANGKVSTPPELDSLTDRGSLQQATGWGLALRLARRLAAGSEATLRSSKLRQDGGRLLLTLDPGRAHLVSAKVASALKNLAKWRGLEPVIVPDANGPSGV
jgi:exopolyphosphatase/guanosine-5'-triphosphate,3'-diphosphate pyrophosphatase